MRFLLHSKDQIAWDHVRDLLCLTLEDYLITILHTLLNLNIQSLHIIDNFATLTMRAVLSRNCSTPSASVTLSLHLHLHSKAYLNLLHHNALSITFGALFDLSILSACASALRAVHISCN